MRGQSWPITSENGIVLAGGWFGKGWFGRGWFGQGLMWARGWFGRGWFGRGWFGQGMIWSGADLAGDDLVRGWFGWGWFGRGWFGRGWRGGAISSRSRSICLYNLILFCYWFWKRPNVSLWFISLVFNWIMFSEVRSRIFAISYVFKQWNCTLDFWLISR